MKTKLNIYIIFFLLISSSNLLIGQENCTYNNGDLVIKLNGWNIDRTDYTHEAFLEVTGIQQANVPLTYSGEQDTEEFGYPWFYYNLGRSQIHFSGVLDNSGDYNGLKRIFSFKLKKRDVFSNVNGIQVGDSLNSVEETFNNQNLCYTLHEGKATYYLNYKHFNLYFITSEEVIKEIGLNTSL